MRPHTAGPRFATAAALFAIIAAGCSADQAPAEPDPTPQYQQVPEDLCDRVRVEEVAERFDLSMVPWYEPASSYWSRPTYSRDTCWFEARAEDGRFATELEDFKPVGPVEITVYHKPPDAQEAYDRYASSEFESREDRESEATTAELTGWWAGGISLEWVGEMNVDNHSVDEVEISSVGVQYLIRHENLVVNGHLDALVPTESTEDAIGLLHDLQRALIDEAVDHLTLTTE